MPRTYETLPWHALACVLVWLVMGGGPLTTRAQTAAPPPPKAPTAAWTLVLDGTEARWPLGTAYPLDSLDAVARHVLTHIRRDGHYFAVLDSLAHDRTATPPTARLFVSPGPEVRLGHVRLLGVTVLDAPTLLRELDTRPGRPLDEARLEADLSHLLRRYEAAGFPLVAVRIAALDLVPGDPPTLDLTLAVEEGRQLVLTGVEVESEGRTTGSYVARLAGLRTGRRLTTYAPEEIRRKLEETEFFREVSTPELRLTPDGGAVLHVALREEPPGAFDLVLGYLPPSGPGAKGSVVGNGHLLLRNLFGGGRVMSLRLNRLPGQVSSVDVRLADPFLFGLPFGGEGQFEGIQQDSTYGKQRYGAELSYRFPGGLRAFVTVNREVTRPGTAGVRLSGGRQRVPRADALFAGLGVRFRRLDRPLNPRRGLLMETNFEEGRKERTALVRTAEGDTTTEATFLRQERLRVAVRAYLPTLARQVFVLGGDAAVLLSPAFDESDLFRFGGATSLRGYDEERFRGRFVARTLAEYRYQIDRASFAYLFFDLGYVDTPATPVLAAQRRFHPGYGFGLQFSTDIGLINASYAINNEDGPTNGRIHVGLSFGL